MYKILNDHTAPGLKQSFCERRVAQNTHLRNIVQISTDIVQI